MISLKSLIATAVVSAATLTYAQDSPVQGYHNRGSTFTTNWNIPSSGSDVYLQIQGPTSAGWAATGIGSAMKGALIFIIYQDGSGNVTVSPRLGKGEFEPKYESTINFELLDGSGVSGGLMTANIKCSNCRSWAGGSLDVTSKSQNFIWAIGDQKVTSKSQTQSLDQHVQNGFYGLDLTKATGGDLQNPFVSLSLANGTTSGTAAPGATGSSSSSGSDNNIAADKVLIAHGVIMGVVFVLCFPFGAALIRLLNNRIPNAFALHRGVQILNFILAVVGAGLGVWRSEMTESHYETFHQYFGSIIIILLLLQAPLGQLHHGKYLKTQKRSVWSYAHIWLGRSTIIAGIVNGGVGLSLDETHPPKGAVIVYSIVAGIVGLGYLLFYFRKERKGEVGGYSSS
ncbi:CBD9-like protein [Choiromyces venosus 120613-1]|uniref:CBD9-like protein n=1 Tax=Choiromyces venosus 120613-1 TaxID=1336337 RepID=A0A3N4JVW8_9PEZI|nr:CBD9-like protein [Choiromyces venosus 120613-1]